jgi:hypothetical protein
MKCIRISGKRKPSEAVLRVGRRVSSLTDSVHLFGFLLRHKIKWLAKNYHRFSSPHEKSLRLFFLSQNQKPLARFDFVDHWGGFLN